MIIFHSLSAATETVALIASPILAELTSPPIAVGGQRFLIQKRTHSNQTGSHLSAGASSSLFRTRKLRSHWMEEHREEEAAVWSMCPGSFSFSFLSRNCKPRSKEQDNQMKTERDTHKQGSGSSACLLDCPRHGV